MWWGRRDLEVRSTSDCALLASREVPQREWNEDLKKRTERKLLEPRVSMQVIAASQRGDAVGFTDGAIELWDILCSP